MPELHQFITFLVACVVLLVVPGPAVLYIVTRSIDQGRRAGLVSVLGIALGTMVHVAAAAFGLSAILITSATAFSVVKYLGAAYLIYLGLTRILNTEGRGDQAVREPRTLRAVFWQGVVVNVLNPKTAMFFFAFLPQFVDPARGTVWLQSFALGTLFVALGVVSDGVYALAAGQVAHLMKGKWRRGARVGRLASGGTYIALGVATAVSGNRK